MKREINFENFHIHDGNKVAYLAAQKVIEFPGELFNPFYVYCNTGLGKTHLLRAIHYELKKKGNVLFFSAQEFEKQLEEKKEFDAPIIIDDLHQISSQYHPMLLATIDAFLAHSRQICFSGNYAPRDLNVDDKIRSRLEGGLICDIQAPKELALVDMIKKKAEESGIILPDDVALELAQVSTASIRTIEGMINRLVAYSSLGNVSLDTNSVRLILKEFYPKGIYSPVSSLLEELKKNATEVLTDVSEKVNIRDEYREKIYIWEMKGFDTTSLKDLLDDDINVLKEKYDTFIQKVGRLVELQKEYGALETSRFPNEAMKIESMLFSPAHVAEIEKLIAEIKEKAEEVKPRKTFESFIIGESNETAYTIYREQIVPSLGKRFNPFLIFGSEGTGKTHFLEAIFSDLKSKNKTIALYDLAMKATTWEIKDSRNIDVLMFDNFHAIFSLPDDVRKNIFKVILDCIKQDKEIILGSNVIASDLSLSEDEKAIFELGLEVELNKPSTDVVQEFIRSGVGDVQAQKMIQEGLPEFSSFYEIDDYLTSYSAQVPEAPAEIIPLGLPGEESVAGEEEKGIEREEAVEEEVKGAKEIKPLKTLKTERFIVSEITSELIEENY
ncbi:MAG: hypothetical protein JSV97_08720 [candidate division WOR-3 bacterium]|nr:MAG: hypothetical protein JSV97_08720 [candidate division WOR-3 bacterium]